eukprot:Pgem_evm1s5049
MAKLELELELFYSPEYPESYIKCSEVGCLECVPIKWSFIDGILGMNEIAFVSACNVFLQEFMSSENLVKSLYFRQDYVNLTNFEKLQNVETIRFDSQISHSTFLDLMEKIPNIKELYVAEKKVLDRHELLD